MSFFKTADTFEVKLDKLLFFAAGWHLPETNKEREFPDEDGKATFVEKSWISQWINYREAKKQLKASTDFESLKKVYYRLEDERSKELFLLLIVFKFMEGIKIRLPLYFETMSSKVLSGDGDYAKARISDEEISLWNGYAKVQNYDLSKLGMGDIKIWASTGTLYIDFVREQYRYKNLVRAEKGDYVIDAGACWGDTALYFADRIGDTGRVFSFEFLPENLDIFSKNMSMNKHLSQQITLIDKAVGEKSGETLFFVPNGPGTSVNENESEVSLKVETMSIDDLVKSEKLPKVDFVKMDIEGSEKAALLGARETIKTFSPKLAVCIYHRREDFWEIPQVIDAISPGYKFYIDHHTCGNNETVLYAKK